MRYRYLTRWLAVVCTTLLILTACAKGDPTKSTGEPPSSTLDPKGDPIELTFMHMYQWVDRQALDEVIRSFENKYPHVTVRVKEQNGRFTGQDGKVMTELFDGVDIFWAAPGSVRTLHEVGLVRDLSQVQLPEWDPLIAGWIEGTSYWQGERYFAPLALNPAQMTLFTPAYEQTGLPLPQADWTYADLETLARQFKDVDQEIFLTLFALLEPAVHAYGGGFYDYATGRWTMDTPENREALSLLGRMVQDGTLLLEFTGVSFSESKGPALSITGPDGTSGYTKIPMPKGPVRRGSRIDSTGVMLMSNSAHPEVAVAFLQELLSEAGQTAFARRGVRPVIDSPSALRAWVEQVGQEVADGFDEALAGAFLESGRPATGVSIYTELNRFFEGHVTLDELLPDLEARLNQ